MVLTNNIIENMGKFSIQSGCITISDPAYPMEKIKHWSGAHMFSAYNGTWQAIIKISQVNLFGKRVSELYAVHSEHLNKSLQWKLYSDIGVGSAQVGIFDCEFYPKKDVGHYYHINENPPDP